MASTGSTLRKGSIPPRRLAIKEKIRSNLVMEPPCLRHLVIGIVHSRPMLLHTWRAGHNGRTGDWNRDRGVGMVRDTRLCHKIPTIEVRGHP